jgi:hypothetical protein
LLRPNRSFFTVLALTTWFVATRNNAAAQAFPLVLAGTGLALTFSIYLLRVREITILSQGYILVALGKWLLDWFEHPGGLPGWNPALLGGICLVLSHWWQRQKRIQAPAEWPWIWQEIYGLGLAALLWCWLGAQFSPAHWLLVTGLLAVGITGYGVLTRAWMIAATAQLFSALCVVHAVRLFCTAKPAWHIALTPLVTLLLLSFSTVLWFHRRPGASPRVRDPLLQFALAYRWVAIALSIAWLYQYIHIREQIWIFVLTGFAVFLAAGFRKNKEMLAASAVYTITGMILFWLPAPEREVVYSGNLAALLILLSQQQIARRLPDRFRLESWVYVLVILAGGLSLWRLSTLWVMREASGFYLTAGWSFLALIFFACGILLRERAYRWLGLGLLGCSLGRIVIFDVWKLQTFYRILSFMALGIVLLVLGYIYSKYQEKIKEWL